MHDLVIKGASVHDGVGGAALVADVAVDGHQIVAVGPTSEVGVGYRTISGEGMLVTPGFVDAHSHADAMPFLEPANPFKLAQGVTTEVVGNCGFSLAPMTASAVAHAREAWTELFPPDVIEAMTFGEYVTRLEDVGCVTNMVALVGHGTVRLSANGLDRALAPGALGRMVAAVEEALDAGAAGLSSGLIYAPGTFADTDELVALATVVGQAGGVYTTHLRDESDGLLAAVDEALAIADRGGCGVQLSHCKVAAPALWGSAGKLLERMHAAASAGLDVGGDQYPYTAGSTVLRALLPSGLAACRPDELRLIADDGVKLAELQRAGRSTLWQDSIGERVTVIQHRRGEVIGRTLTELGGGAELLSVVCRLVADDPASAIVIELVDEADLRQIMRDPSIGVGSDNALPFGRQHPRTWGTFPHLLGRYVREEGVLDWPTAIAKMTSVSARRFGLADRGVIRPGAVADLVVVDPDVVGHRASYETPSTPPDGIPYVVLGGTVVIDDGTFTGARAGSVVRGATAGAGAAPMPRRSQP